MPSSRHGGDLRVVPMLDERARSSSRTAVIGDPRRRDSGSPLACFQRPLAAGSQAGVFERSATALSGPNRTPLAMEHVGAWVHECMKINLTRRRRVNEYEMISSFT